MQKFKGTLETNFYWIIPILLGVSKTNVNNEAVVYALHITPLFELGFNWSADRRNKTHSEKEEIIKFTITNLDKNGKITHDKNKVVRHTIYNIIKESNV